MREGAQTCYDCEHWQASGHLVTPGAEPHILDMLGRCVEPSLLGAVDVALRPAWTTAGMGCSRWQQRETAEPPRLYGDAVDFVRVMASRPVGLIDRE